MPRHYSGTCEHCGAAYSKRPSPRFCSFECSKPYRGREHRDCGELHAVTRKWRERAEQLEAALRGVMSSIECYRALNYPKPEDQWDEYDQMMIPAWQTARAALEES